MNIHEYQAKKLLEQYGVPVPKGINVSSADDVDKALAEFAGGRVVVKAQIHAGGRGKGTFKDGFQGGVQLCQSKQIAKAAALHMLNNVLVTEQTGPAGKCVHNVYLTELADIAKEYYLALLLDRSRSQLVVIASSSGGVDIEEVAKTNPGAIAKIFIDPTIGLQDFQCRQLAFKLGFTGEAFTQLISILKKLFQLYKDKDAAMIEINPLVVTKQNTLVALDAKITFDDNALYRQKDIAVLHDSSEEDPKEVEAYKCGLSYIALDGSIACLVNGAGLAMATMDIIHYFGGHPANFLDVGGSATEEQIANAFKIILSDPKIKGVLVNIFGGIAKCDTIASGIINAAKSVKISVPLVVRLEGTNSEKGRALLKESGLPLHSASSLEEAAKMVVELSK